LEALKVLWDDMSRLPESLNKLINALSRLPGIGSRTAQRLAFHIIKSPPEEACELAESLTEAVEKVVPCSICGNFTDKQVCLICESARRDASTVCVVENPQDVLAIEQSGRYSGLYHVLMGALSPLDGIGPGDLKINELAERVQKGGINEVIIATDPNVEGEATAEYIKEILQDCNIKITRLAYGIPIGGNLEYADGPTLGRALEGRRSF